MPLTKEEIQRQLDDSAQAVVSVNLVMGNMCAIVRTEPNGEVSVAAPAINAADIAEMLYKAADLYASYAGGMIDTSQIKQLKH